MPEPTQQAASERIELDPIEQRVLGCLLEKQRTVPASYPLSFNALRTACNQSSSRDPVVDWAADPIRDAVGRLKTRGLVRVVWTGQGSRVLKYHQLLDEELALQPDERALLTVLLLRGAQSAGELRTRTERLHEFADKDTVDARLRSLAALPTPLVRQLERRPGQQEHRWVHLLGAVPEVTAVSQSHRPDVDRDVVLAAGAAARDAAVARGYDAVAGAYADQLADELERKPFDRWLLDRLAGLSTPGPIVDVGCGPGHVAAYLTAAGVRAVGLDLSAGMIDEARRRYPSIDFEVGDLNRLLRPRTAAAWAGLSAWYALVHLAGSELPATIAGLARVLRPGGWIALALHAGDEVRHVEQLCGQPVDLDFVLHDRDEVMAAVVAAGLVDIESYLRTPYPGEAETERLYVLARTPE